MSDTKTKLPEGRIIFRFTPDQEEKVGSYDDMAAEYIVMECRGGNAGLIVYGKHPRTGEWVSNWSGRHVIRRLLAEAKIRCPVCSWPLAISARDGCVPGNCSERPRPAGDQP